MRLRPKLHLLLSLIPLGLSVSGCVPQYCDGASGLLPPVASGAPAPMAGPAPPGGEMEAAPAMVPMAGGGLTQTVFSADTGTGFRVEVRDLLVGPLQRATGITFPGAAVLELRSGRGRFSIEGQPRELPPGATFELGTGQSLDIVNEGEVPIAIRLYVFLAQGGS